MRTVSICSSTIAAIFAAMLAACGGSEESAAQSTSGGTIDSRRPNSTEENSQASQAAYPETDPGEGALAIGAKVFTFTVTECRLGTGGAFDLMGNAAGGDFKMTQFFLNEEWYQTTLSVDIEGPTEIFAILFSSFKGAVPATVKGNRILWVWTFDELDTVADSSTRLGEGHLSATCP